MVWNMLLESPRALTTVEIAKSMGKTEKEVIGILNSLSLRGVPIYEERRKNILYYGVTVRISEKKLNELLLSDDQ